MFARMQKPFLTLETGEAYQPVLLTYDVYRQDELIAILDKLTCCERNTKANSWNWFWNGEGNDFAQDLKHTHLLGVLTISEDKLCIYLRSFNRAYLAVSFFQKRLGSHIAKAHHADFINTVFGLDERLPDNFFTVFKEKELARIASQRISDYEMLQKKCELADTAEQALAILSAYAETESQKCLPYMERYTFQENVDGDSQDVFLGFYIFLRGRELVAIRRWFGDTNYDLGDVAKAISPPVLME